jgi:hypothetical protein
MACEPAAQEKSAAQNWQTASYGDGGREQKMRTLETSPTTADPRPTLGAPGAVPARRDTRFDSLRGLLLVTMALNHIPSDLHPLTDGALGFVSSAEGFVFLSGLVLGLVYARKRREVGPDVVRTAAWRRVRQLYGAHLFTYGTVLALALGLLRLTGQTPGVLPELFFTHPGEALVSGALLLYRPGLLDILPMYCVFAALLPGLLGADAAGRRAWWLAGSVGLWAVAQVFAPAGPWLAGPVNSGAFSLTAWQLLFVVGVFIGADRAPPPRTALVFVAAAAALWLTLVHHGLAPAPWSDGQLDLLTSKVKLGPLRVIHFALIAVTVAALARRWPRAFAWPWLAPLGRHSLVVFSGHVVVAAMILCLPALAESAVGRGFGTVTMLGALTLLALGAEAWDRRSRPDASAHLRWTVFARNRRRYTGHPVSTV